MPFKYSFISNVFERLRQHIKVLPETKSKDISMACTQKAFQNKKKIKWLTYKVVKGKEKLE